jgi:transmembrane sensor
MNSPDWQILIEKYLANTISKDELDQLLAAVAEQKDFDGLSSVLKSHWEKAKEKIATEKTDWDKKFEEMMEEASRETPVIPLYSKQKSKWYLGVSAAAVLVLMLSAGTFFLFFNKNRRELVQTQQQRLKNDVAPGGNKAILTLSNGSQIILDSAQNGTLAQQGNTKIIKTDSGKLAYKSINEKPSEVVYNVLTTPMGGQYQLTLPDGTHVWLNAASSIRYPTAFTGKERNVEVTGEAYFEVEHDSKMPFYVKVRNETIKDLGTHFNVNAYGDEPVMKTTLLEGAISIGDANSSKILKPGQQAVISGDNNDKIKIENDVDVEQVVAWKNGLFHYNNASVQEVLRQMSRWYNVQVVYEKTPTSHLAGIVGRNINLSEAIKMLQNNGIKCRIEEKKLIVE